jgi:SRSO17 transposase
MAAGLLMELEDYNCWSIAEAVGHRGPHRLQHLLSRAVWDDRQVLDAAAAWAVAQLDDGDAVLLVDETADEKSSAAAVGAARQYCGTVGGIALCQVAVTLTFATSRGAGALCACSPSCTWPSPPRWTACPCRPGDRPDPGHHP